MEASPEIDAVSQPVNKITDVLTTEEIRDFIEPSDAQGWLAIVTTWMVITFSLALISIYPAWWTLAIALILLGGRHLALAILMHEASHYSLFKTRRLNDIVGKWLCAAPAWQNLTGYRTHHLAHHAFTGTEKDTDINLIEGFPTTTLGLVRKFTRDLSGLTALKRILGLVLMDLEIISYTASGGAIKTTKTDRPFSSYMQAFARNTGPTIIANGLLLIICVLLGHPEAFGVWILAYMTTFSLFLRIRSIAEHACTDSSGNQFLNTRTTYASPLARLTVAPHYVNYHLEHHLLMTVPCYKLKKLHRLLLDRNVYDTSPKAENYFDVLNIARGAA